MLRACFCQRLRVSLSPFFFFFNDTATTEIYTLSLHDALPISKFEAVVVVCVFAGVIAILALLFRMPGPLVVHVQDDRSEEHTSELQSRLHLVCRLLLEKKKKHKTCQT